MSPRRADDGSVLADTNRSVTSLALRGSPPLRSLRQTERFTKSSSSHDLKAHCVDKRIRAFVVPTQPPPSLVFGDRIHADHRRTWGSLQCTEEPQSCLVPCPSAPESLGFPDDVIAAQQQASVFAPNPDCFGVVLVAGQQQRDPEASVNESHSP